MSRLVVGSTDCRISKVVTVLKSTSTFSYFLEKWTDVARELDTERILFKKLKRDLALNLISLTELLDELIEEWVSRNGEKAELKELIRVFQDNELGNCADSLRRAFVPGDVKTEDSLSKSQSQTAPSTSSSLLSPGKLIGMVTGQLSEVIEFMSKNKYGGSPLHFAVENENESVAKEVFGNYGEAILNMRNLDGQSALHIAANLKSLRMIKCLINMGADPELKDERGLTFLHVLLDSEITPQLFDDIVVYLVLEKKLSRLFNITGGDLSMTPLQSAVNCMEVEERTLWLLHSNDVDFNTMDADRSSLLHLAVASGRSANFILLLIKYGVEANHRNSFGRNPLHVAAKFGNGTEAKLFEITRALYAKELDVDEVDLYGQSVMQLAIENGRSAEYLRLLLELGANWKQLCNWKKNYLHIAAKCGTPSTIQVFLDLKGLNINATDLDGNTPLHCAVELSAIFGENKNMIQNAKLLIENGAAVTSENNKGLTPLELSLQQNYSDDVKNILKRIMLAQIE